MKSKTQMEAMLNGPPSFIRRLTGWDAQILLWWRHIQQTQSNIMSIAFKSTANLTAILLFTIWVNVFPIELVRWMPGHVQVFRISLGEKNWDSSYRYLQVVISTVLLLELIPKPFVFLLSRVFFFFNETTDLVTDERCTFEIAVAWRGTSWQRYPQGSFLISVSSSSCKYYTLSDELTRAFYSTRHSEKKDCILHSHDWKCLNFFDRLVRLRTQWED